MTACGPPNVIEAAQEDPKWDMRSFVCSKLWNQPDHGFPVDFTDNNRIASVWLMSEVSHLKPDICNRNTSITNPVKICDNVLCIIISIEVCCREASMTFLAQRCSSVFAIAGFDWPLWTPHPEVAQHDQWLYELVLTPRSGVNVIANGTDTSVQCVD